MTIYFWFAGGMMTGLAAAFVLVPLRAGVVANTGSRALRHGLAAIAVAAFAATVILAYRALGRPDLLDRQSTVAALPHPGARTTAPGESLDSVASAAAQLEQRLTRAGGDRSDWLLLAQSYDFLGRPEDAARARARADGAPAQTIDGEASAPGADPISGYERRVSANPRDASAWLALANVHRQRRDFAQARDAFAKVIALDAMSADAWADYADVLGSLAGGSLAGEAAAAVDRALSIDDGHPKALWLKASLAHEQHRYRDALTLWKRLRGVLPPDSPDARIVDANIAEATELLAGVPTVRAVQAATAPVEVTGTVSIDKKLAGRVAPGDTLFIYAKSADSPGPPLAVLKTAADAWPVNFRLDDTLAMMPERKLSSFEKVVIEARISRSGRALPASGDLYTVSPVLRPADGKKLQLVISREVS